MPVTLAVQLENIVQLAYRGCGCVDFAALIRAKCYLVAPRALAPGATGVLRWDKTEWLGG
jgi:hypothetical protein